MKGGKGISRGKERRGKIGSRTLSTGRKKVKLKTDLLGTPSLTKEKRRIRGGERNQRPLTELG